MNRQPRHTTDTDQVTDRRNFLRTASLVAGAAALQPHVATSAKQTTSANQQIGVGFIGVGGRAQAHLDIMNQMNQAGVAKPVAVCDVYRPRLEAASKKAGGAKMYMKHEALLDDPNVDVVCIATPDRLHAPQAIDALNAGKDVYCEKPLTHWDQFELAKKVQAAANKNQRLVQVGTQYMADENYPKVRKMIADGLIGKPVHVQCSYMRRGDWGERMNIPDPNAQAGPDLLWERFLGDAPQVPFDVSRFFQWRLYLDYAGGPATDLLVHAYTPVFCLLGLDFPRRVLGGGGTFQYNREVPDQCNIIADYKDGPSVVLLNSLSNYTGTDTIIRGTDGLISWKMLGAHDSKGIRIVPLEKEEIFLPWKGFGNTQKLWDNLLTCVKTREQPFSSIEMAVRVQAPLSMGVISHLKDKATLFDFDNQSIQLS